MRKSLRGCSILGGYDTTFFHIGPEPMRRDALQKSKIKNVINECISFTAMNVQETSIEELTFLRDLYREIDVV